MNYRDNDIAIIGMSGRFPEADNLYSFADNLRNGRDSVRPLSASRMNATSLVPGRDYKVFAFMENIDRFDNEFFHVVLGEANFMSPHQRILLELTHEALESAGYTKSMLAGYRTSVFVSSNPSDYFRLAKDFNPLLVTGNISSVLAGRISRHFGFTGNAVHVDTACSSSLVALQIAYQELISRKCDLSIVGGINLSIFPTLGKADRESGITSEEGRSKTFSDRADGAGLGEAAACVLLKRVDRAIADKDNILAVIRSIAVNQDGARSSTLSAPSSIAQAEVITEAIQLAGVDAESISYVEAHGTGTLLGDPIEMEGLRLAFANFTENKHFCYISALKSNIGHCDNVSGLAGLVKVVLSMRSQELYPSINMDAPNPMIDFQDSPVVVNTQLRKWESFGRPRLAGLSSFGISGTNCHTIVQEYVAPSVTYARRPHIICLSAKSKQSLFSYQSKLKQFLVRNPKVHLEEVSFTLNCGRDHYSVRRSFVVETIEQLIDQLDCQDMPEPVAPPETLWWLFSDSRVVSDEMLQELSQSIPVFGKSFRECLSGFNTNGNAVKDFAYGVAMYKLMEELKLPVKFITGVGVGKQVVSFLLGKSDLKGVNLVEDGKSVPRWREFIQQRLSRANSLVVETGSCSNQYQLLLAQRVDEKFEAFGVVEHPSLRGLLEGLSKLYVAGYTPDWRGVYNGCPRRIDLPTYAFDKNRCWLDYPAPEGSWCHELMWQELAGAVIEVVPTTFIVIGDNEAALSIENGLKKANQNTILVDHNFRLRHDTDGTEFNWNDERFFKELVRYLTSVVAGRLTFVHTRSGNNPTRSLHEDLHQSLFSVMLLVQALEFDLPKSRLIVVTKNGGNINSEDRIVYPTSTSVFGFLAGVKSEWPTLSMKCVDINESTAVQLLIDEMQIADDHLVVALRKSKRYARSFKIAERREPFKLKAGGIYLVSGGSSGIGLQVLKGLAPYKATFIIVGRRSLPPRSLWRYVTEQNDPQLAQTIRDFLWVEGQGSKVFYYSSDVSDDLKIPTILREVKERFGDVNGVMHAAGIGGALRLGRHSVESFEEVLLPKIYGVENLYRHLDALKLDFFICFSSLNAIVGVERESNYCAANAYLDGFSAMLNANGIRASTVRWPFWTETGMGHRLRPYEDSDVEEMISITNDEGLRLLQQILFGGYTDLLISKADPLALPKNVYFVSKGASSKANVPSIKKTRAFTETAEDEEYKTLEELLIAIWKRVLSKSNVLATDNFFKIGGHSLLGIQVRNQIERKTGIRLEYRDIMENPSVESLAARLRSLQGDHRPSGNKIVPAPVSELYPVSEGQRTLWAAHYSEDRNSIYNVCLAYHVAIKIEPKVLTNAVRMLIERHEILRTKFAMRDGEIFQKVCSVDEVNVPIEYPTESDMDYIETGLKLPFMLDSGLLMRIWVVDKGHASTLVVISVHHIAFDGWSAKILMPELIEIYAALVSNRQPDLVPLSIQYKDYAYWEQQRSGEERSAIGKAFWYQYLKSLPAPISLATDFDRPDNRKGAGKIVRFSLSSSSKKGLDRISQAEGVSKFSIGLTLLQLLLYRYTSQQDFFIGVPSTLRQVQDLENQIGYYVSMLPVRCQLKANDNFYDALYRTRDVVNELQAHQSYPLSRVIKDLGITREIGRNHLFDVTYSYEHEVDHGEAASAPVVETVDFLAVNSRYDLEFNLVEMPNSLSGNVIYDTALFAEETIQEMIIHYRALVEIVTLTQTIDSMPIVGGESKKRSIESEIDFDI